MHMATRTSALVILLAITAFTLAPQTAFSDPDEATIGFYLTDATGRCSSLEPPSCASEDVQVSGDLFNPYYAVLCVFNGDPDTGLRAMSCGIRYDGASSSGVDVLSWTHCGDGLEFPSDDWPDSGAGSRITWSTCQKETPDGYEGGVTAVVGYFYVTAYSPDRLEVITNDRLQTEPELLIAYCGEGPNSGIEVTIHPDHIGFLGFSDDGSEKGDLHCNQVIREDRTWGQIKSLYDNR